MIASWPGKISEGSTSDHISAFYDYLPTLAELAGIENVPSNDGISFLPTLMGDNKQLEHDYLYWEFPEYNGQVAIREQDYKLIWKDLLGENPKIEIYNLKEDPEELNNIANDHPDLIQEFSRIITKEHRLAAIERFRIPLLDTDSLSMSIQ